MIDRLTRWLYERKGSHYWVVLMTGEGAVSVSVAAVTVVMISTYYDPPLATVVWVTAFGCAMTLLATFFATFRGRRELRKLNEWRKNPAPTATETVEAWEIATTLTLRQYRRDSGLVSILAVVPTSWVAMHYLETGWSGFLAMLVVCIVPAAYATVFSYQVGELLSRPMVEHVATALPDDFPFKDHGLPVAFRLKLALPAYTAGAAMLVATLVVNENGTRSMLIVTLLSGAVGLALSHELTVLLSESITRPITDVRRELARVRGGDYSARMPVVSSDELGELAHDFNLMARGLEEREEMREAFGTYVDKEVVSIILSGQFPQTGLEVDVSILFCDVRGFTSYAERAQATEVIATLNTLFSEIVPIVEQYGGHVDKFMGDGLLAVFGAPEFFPDHADRALDAAVEIVQCSASGLSIAAGVNSGQVVAGPIGGAGRLNFSVIGDAVNIAARVEAATRQTGDDVLFTAATRDRLTRPRELVSRGSLPLKGKAEPLELFAPVRELAPQPAAADSSSSNA